MVLELAVGDRSYSAGVPHEPRILIDATAVPADRGGVGRYVDSLVAALDADGARLTVVCQPRDLDLYDQLAPNTRIVPASQATSTRTARLTWEQTTLPRLIRRLGVDVLHSQHHTLPLANPVASVVTLHDATFFTDAVLHSSVKAGFFRAWTSTALRRASLCIVPSVATADELAKVAHVSGLEIIQHGVDVERFHPPFPEEVAAARAAVGLGSTPYVAFLGALEPWKNVPALIRGFAPRGRLAPVAARAGAGRAAGLGLSGREGFGRGAAPFPRDSCRLPAVRHFGRIPQRG